MARTVTFTIRHPDDTAWVSAVVKFRLLTGDYTATVQYPRYTLSAVATIADGSGSIELWQNEGGAEDTLYECILPSGETFTFTVPAGTADITLSTLRGGSFPSGVTGTLFNLSGYASLAAAITAIGATEGTLLIDMSDTLAGNVTVPSTLTLLWFSPSNIIDVDSNTLTINGPIEAGLYEIFTSNSGTLAINGPTVELYPQWWGAVGNGSNDDTIAIQSAFDALRSIGGVIKFPPVTVRYKVAGTITLGCSDVHVIGSGYSSEIRQTTDNKRLFFASGKDGITFEDVYCYGVGVYDNSWTGPGDSFARGIEIKLGTNISVIDCITRNFAQTGIFVDGCTDVLIRGNKVEGTHVLGTAIVVNDNDQYGIWCNLNAGGEGAIISENTVIYTTQGLHVTTEYPHVSMVGNLIHDIPGQHGIYVAKGSNITITGNTIHDCGIDGIKANLATVAVTNFVVGNNAIETVLGAGIKLGSTNAGGTMTGGTVSGNVIKTANRGIVLNLNARGVAITGNSVHTTTSHGIFVSGSACDDTTIVGNTLRSIGLNGIHIVGGTGEGFLIHDNIVSEANAESGTAYGIYLVSGTDISVCGNRVTDDDGEQIYAFYALSAVSGLRVINNTFLDGVTNNVRADGTIEEWYGNDYGGDELSGGLNINSSLSFERTLRTTTGSDATLWQLALEDESVYMVEISLVGKLAGSTEVAGYVETGLFFRNGGAATQEGSTDTDVSIVGGSFAGVHALGVSGNNVRIRVNSDGVANYDWKVKVSVTKLFD